MWQSILAIVALPPSEQLVFTLRRRLVFQGKPLSYGRSMDQVKRLFKTGSCKYEQEIHERLTYKSGALIKAVGGTLWHWSYYDLEDYFLRFNRYTSMMARTRFESGKFCPPPILLALRLPVNFLYRYIVKLGFLDGWPGFLWALFGSFYSFVKYAKLQELYRDDAGGT